MDDRKHNSIEPWGDWEYGTGRTRPPKSHSGMIAALLILIILLCGVVCSARVTLHRHTLGQVYAGTVLSAFITTAMMLIPHWIIQYLQSA